MNRKMKIFLWMATIVLISIIFLLFLLPKGKKEGGELFVNLTVESIAFKHNEFIPSRYTCEGSNINPPLKLGNLDPKAVSLAIIVDDPDAPIGTFVHWVAWNIPPVSEIPEAIPKEAKVLRPLKMMQGKNDFGRYGYDGPCPPPGHGIHHYHFKVYVLDATLELKPGAGKRELEKAMKGHILQQGELVGLYRR